MPALSTSVHGHLQHAQIRGNITRGGRLSILCWKLVDVNVYTAECSGGEIKLALLRRSHQRIYTVGQGLVLCGFVIRTGHRAGPEKQRVHSPERFGDMLVKVQFYSGVVIGAEPVVLLHVHHKRSESLKRVIAMPEPSTFSRVAMSLDWILLISSSLSSSPPANSTHNLTSDQGLEQLWLMLRLTREYLMELMGLK
ncbi:hypothetical protein RRG08_054404 [Elysia crispata]|uniref:Uncharacterized protein n=1 Tax=Elysia crispata TaxID=231223 RepID=A0AAE1B4D7_9GAST|nr:hypothetical protein RRG08_054404 [Elysia crispata]